MSPHNWIHLFLFFCHQHAALHGGLFKICSKLQPYLRTYQSKDVKDLKNYFHPQTLFGGLDLEGKIDVHTTQLEWIWQFSGFEVFFYVTRMYPRTSDFGPGLDNISIQHYWIPVGRKWILIFKYLNTSHFNSYFYTSFFGIKILQYYNYNITKYTNIKNKKKFWEALDKLKIGVINRGVTQFLSMGLNSVKWTEQI